MLIAIILVLAIAAIAFVVRRRRLRLRAAPDVAAEYERLSSAYRASCVPYKLYVVLGKTPPADQEARFHAAESAFADFVLGLDGNRFAALAVHLDTTARTHGGPAPFDYVCEFLHEEQERIRHNRREIDGFVFRFSMGFIPAPAPLYWPYRPRGAALPASTSPRA